MSALTDDVRRSSLQPATWPNLVRLLFALAIPNGTRFTASSGDLVQDVRMTAVDCNHIEENFIFHSSIIIPCRYWDCRTLKVFIVGGFVL